MKKDTEEQFEVKAQTHILDLDVSVYDDDEKIAAEYKELVLNEIEKEKSRHE